MNFDISVIPSGWLYVLIFILKYVEVSISTLRIVIVTKGERGKGAFIAFFEVMLWVLIAGIVLVDILEDPFKIVIYGAAFAVGNYTGSKLEEKLALGTINMQAIVSRDVGIDLAAKIRDFGLAVTTVDGLGRDTEKTILYLHIPRRKIKTTIDYIKSQNSTAVITIHEIRPIYGGYHKLKK
jgi:uncharacterized protein YebE (UPF0316 family)